MFQLRNKKTIFLLRTLKKSLNSVRMTSIYHRARNKTILRVKIFKFSCQSVIIFVLGAQKNRLNETVLSSTHKICFDS